MSVGQTEYITYYFQKRTKEKKRKKKAEKIVFVFQNRSKPKRNIISKKIKVSIFRFSFVKHKPYIMECLHYKYNLEICVMLT